MNFIKRIFKKDKSTNNIDNFSVDEEGNVSGVYSTKLNNQNVEIQVNTTTEFLEKFENNQNCIDSCETVTADDEIKLPIDYPIFRLKGDKKVLDKLFQTQEIAAFKGYQSFLFSKEQFNRLLQETTKYEESSKIIALTAELNNKGISLEKENKIEEAIKVYEENVSIGHPATHSYERLMILYRKRKETEKEINVINRAIEVFEIENKKRADATIASKSNLKDIVNKALIDNKCVIDENGLTCFNPYDLHKYKSRLELLTNENKFKKIILPTKANIHRAIRPTLGERYENVKLKFVEFDFYNSGEDRSNSFISDIKNKSEILKIQNEFKKLISDAERFEEDYDYNSASAIYEQIVSENYYLTTPYDRLIKIYSNAKLKNDELRVLELSIEFFSNLRNNQQDYVLTIAKKYGKLDFAEDYIKNEKKITYYGGAFELYNPYPIIEKWKTRLSTKTK